jgi:hypothetical protein
MSDTIARMIKATVSNLSSGRCKATVSSIPGSAFLDATAVRISGPGGLRELRFEGRELCLCRDLRETYVEVVQPQIVEAVDELLSQTAATDGMYETNDERRGMTMRVDISYHETPPGQHEVDKWAEEGYEVVAVASVVRQRTTVWYTYLRKVRGAEQSLVE